MFEGKNYIGAHSRFYNSSMGYASYMGDNNLFTDCNIGKFCSIGSNIRLVSSSHAIENVISTYPAFFSNKFNYFSFVDKPLYEEIPKTSNGYSLEVGNDVWIGDNVLIKGGITVGNGAVIAMGAVVTKDVPDFAIVGGVPAKIIRYRFSGEEISKLNKLKWWDKPNEWLRANAVKFNDADTFLREINCEE